MKLPISQHLTPDLLSRLRHLGQLGKRLGAHVYLVGGPVRDLLLGRDLLDIDLAIEGDAMSYARHLAETEGGEVTEYPEFGGATVTLSDCKRVDITATRSETYVRPGALPQVVPADTLHDLARRDFSINAMALSLHPDSFSEVIDPYDGQLHLRQKRLQALHERSFLDDPTRILRAARFCARLQLTAEQNTTSWIQEALQSGALSTVSAQRLLVELRYMLAETTSAAAVRLLHAWGALEHLGLGHADDDEVAGRLLQLERVHDAEIALELKTDPIARFCASLGLLLSPERLATWLQQWPLTAAELDGAREASRLAHCPPASLFSTSTESSTLYQELHRLPDAALLAGWVTAEDAGRSNLERFSTQLAATMSDINGQDLLARGYRPGPLFSAALWAALAAKLDEKADRDRQLQVALATMRTGPPPG